MNGLPPLSLLFVGGCHNTLWFGARVAFGVYRVPGNDADWLSLRLVRRKS